MITSLLETGLDELTEEGYAPPITDSGLLTLNP